MPPREPRILVLNPGSTSTKIAIFEGEQCIRTETLPYPPQGHKEPAALLGQIPQRVAQVRRFLGADEFVIDAIAARGGPLRPLEGGVYAIDDAMLADARDPHFIDHPARIACLMAAEISEGKLPCYVVDPISTDEYSELSRISGLKELPRKSLTHALNMKYTAKFYARNLPARYEWLNLITAHLGGGITIAIHERGRMIDSVDSNGEGPMSPQRTGGLRVDDLARLALASNQTPDQFVRHLTRKGGLVSHLGTADAVEIEERIERGDADAKLVFQALAYQVAKHIAAFSATVCGNLDAIVLTGGLARSKMLTGWIKERVQFLAPVEILPGEFEMEALAEGVLQVLQGKELVKCYPSATCV